MNYQKPTKNEEENHTILYDYEKKYENVFNMSQKTTIKVKKWRNKHFKK